MVWINDHSYTHGACQCAWGGVKDSGLGRSHSKFGFYECVNIKMLSWEPSRLPDIWWQPYDEVLGKAIRASARLLYGRDGRRKQGAARGRACRCCESPAARCAARCDASSRRAPSELDPQTVGRGQAADRGGEDRRHRPRTCGRRGRCVPADHDVSARRGAALARMHLGPPSARTATEVRTVSPSSAASLKLVGRSVEHGHRQLRCDSGAVLAGEAPSGIRLGASDDPPAPAHLAAAKMRSPSG